VVAEEQPADGVGVQCSRVEVVGGGAEVGDLAAARGAAERNPATSSPPCVCPSG